MTNTTRNGEKEDEENKNQDKKDKDNHRFVKLPPTGFAGSTGRGVRGRRLVGFLTITDIKNGQLVSVICRDEGDDIGLWWFQVLYLKHTSFRYSYPAVNFSGFPEAF